MGVISIEFADKVEGEPCPCCGGRTTHLTRFVYSNEEAHAVYYAAFSDKHEERMVSVLVSLGEWGGWDKEEAPNNRVAFALRIRLAAAEYQMMVTDATKSSWHDATFLGRMLSRQEALKHPWLQEAFHIADHIVTEDQEVQDYLDGTDTA
jgi:hypothetical protein